MKTVLCFQLKDHGVKEDELQSILNYLLTMHEVGVLLSAAIPISPPDGAKTLLLSDFVSSLWHPHTLYKK